MTRHPGNSDFTQPGERLLSDREGSVDLVRTEFVTVFDQNNPLQLESGRSLGPIQVAYEAYGNLNERRDNVILVAHALSGDAHAAGRHHENDPKPGWWDIIIGPGKALDTNRYFVICSNCLGGCMGTTGPSSIDPRTGEPYGLNFPLITISDMVEVQRQLLDHLGIEKLLAVVGGSMGGGIVLDWAIRYPDQVAAAIPIATTSRLSAQSIAFDAVGRNAILTDKNFRNGDYYKFKKYPNVGLAVARMIGHITYLSEEAMHEKFGRRLRDARDYQYILEKKEFSVETYLDYQGSTFVDRFDANTYLYFTKAIDYFDLERLYGSLTEAMAATKSRFLVISFDSDWLYPPRQSQRIVNALITADKDVSYCNIQCSYGHDSFLLESQVQGNLIRGFLNDVYSTLEPGNTAEPTDKPCSASLSNDDVGAVRSSGSIFAGSRVDHRQIAQLIPPDSTVLDLGCGDGQLLAMLKEKKNIQGMGVTLNENDVQACLGRGVSVVQFDINHCLSGFVEKSYDFVVLSQTLQVIRHPEVVVREMLRVGKKVVVSFPNFAYWRSRLQMLFWGKAPIWSGLPHSWFDKPSVNFLSINDFEEFIHEHLHAQLVRRIPLSSRSGREVRMCPNLLADEAIFVIADA